MALFGWVLQGLAYHFEDVRSSEKPIEISSVDGHFGVEQNIVLIGFLGEHLRCIFLALSQVGIGFSNL